MSYTWHWTVYSFCESWIIFSRRFIRCRHSFHPRVVTNDPICFDSFLFYSSGRHATGCDSYHNNDKDVIKRCSQRTVPLNFESHQAQRYRYKKSSLSIVSNHIVSVTKIKSCLCPPWKTISYQQHTGTFYLKSCLLSLAIMIVH